MAQQVEAWIASLAMTDENYALVIPAKAGIQYAAAYRFYH